MFQHNYAEAVKYLGHVVASGTYSLLPNYGDNWKIDNSMESIFEIPNKMNSDPGLALGTNIPHFFTTRSTTNYQGYGFHCPTKDLFDAFEPDDPRITYTFTMTGDRYLNDVEDQNNIGNSPSPYGDRKIEVPYYKRIGYYPWIISYNIRYIRYDDVLLLYAEALNETGQSTMALTYLNEIRRRARNSDPWDSDREKQVYVPQTDVNTTLPDITITDQDSLRKIIWHERRCELAMEGWRREDLCRQRRFGQVMKAYYLKHKSDSSNQSSKGQFFDENRDYLLPIPQTEIDYSDGMIKQNPGY
jgi:hypothetical protein